MTFFGKKLLMKLKSSPLYICLTLILTYSGTIAYSQESAYFDNTFEQLTKAQEYFDLELYGQAIHHIDLYIDKTHATQESKKKLNSYLEALSLKYISQLRLDLPEGEENLKYFVNQNHPSPLITDAAYEIGNYYYNEKQYASSIKYFDKIDIDALPEIKMSELVFKKGYCHFVKKEFANAQYNFSYSKDIQNKFFYPINYYYGMCEYFNGDYENAVKSFQRVEDNYIYKSQIPYYIAQIYFAEKKYDKLISYGKNAVQKPDTKKKKEIHLLLGQTYFQRNNYEKALPHLEYYEDNTDALTLEEFYQLAFTQYRLGHCDSAIDNFLEINLEDSKLGQVVNYYLADCYEKQGDKQSSRAAFKKVSQMDYDLGMKEEATFNYGKLSAEMGLEREAINVLMDVERSSPYYTETQSIINDILVNTGDFDNAISILESLPNLNTELEKTYQDVTFNRAIQHLAEGQPEEAKTMFTKSYKYSYNKLLVAQAYYWEANMLSNEGDYDNSIAAFDKYQRAAKSISNLPKETQTYMGHYNQAYNFLKTNQFEAAALEFKQAIIGMNRNEDQIKSSAIYERVLPDAYLRAGDCLFKINRYDDAVTYYDQSIDRQAVGYVYSLYQKGLIEGLLGEPYQKVITMERITDNHPDSDYADDALLQLGDTYLSLGSPIPAANAFKKLRTDYKGRSNLINAANLKLGLINYNEGDAESALTYYKSVFTNNPNPQESQEALIAIEEIYIDDLGKSDEYFNFLKTIPGYEISAFTKDSINYRIGEIQYQNANYERAITAFDDYLKVYSSGYYRLNARYFRGESLSILKKYSIALRDYEAIIKEGISDYYERATKKAALISYNHDQNFNKAYKYYSLWEKQTQNLEDKYQAQLGLMRSAFRTGNNDGVKTYSNKVNQNPLATNEDKSSAMYYLAKVSYRTGLLEQAASAFQQVASLSNNNQAAESRYMLAKIALDKNDLDGAENKANAANEKNKNYPTWIAKSILLLSDVYVIKGDLLNARAAVEAIIENFSSDELLLKEAKEKLAIIEQKEVESNRIKIENVDGILELDTSGN
ncbi:MAG: tetratricopeptide (TPR) repeat protein [Saprospiraceae bacterium]|jgi:tetratricopeptide (TPR) repeat protein